MTRTFWTHHSGAALTAKLDLLDLPRSCMTAVHAFLDRVGRRRCFDRAGLPLADEIGNPYRRTRLKGLAVASAK